MDEWLSEPDNRKIELCFESEIDDGRHFIWGRPVYEIEQNEENLARYGGPMPWPPLPYVDDLGNELGNDDLHFDHERLIEERVADFFLFKKDDESRVRQLWAIENWKKWEKECKENGSDPYEHVDCYYTEDADYTRDVIPYTLIHAVREMIKPKGYWNRLILLEFHEDKQHSLHNAWK